ncbi:Uncharacterized membrane protein YsdA, DUF1294 family [Clostridium collagenovorans DSM 3089]|uniref:Uncharacterized membrane protein YsdA, DUF1294 family n=1 Tax=Clostridium collagenovorans DSM 3089 TaxID=1121306 RepID=A0A1M5TFV1_9CLOT|nr:DUF1294 domain-containing protein [Clostridium collagenovorans]SHH49243.1 Uncharacterized membrane protein YsdA, DUF1294 family [Clostridium collagenovorans DSM 3089]
MNNFFIYLVAINLIAFIFMYEDKRRAKRKQWRIPEATLLGISTIGGSLGAYIGMYSFRHKTKHLKFTLGIPIIFIIQLFIIMKYIKTPLL